MAFRCQMCGIAQPERTKPKRLVTEVKVLEHYAFSRNDRGQLIRSHVGSGRQISKELFVCDMCDKRWREEHPAPVVLAPQEPEPIVAAGP